MMARSQAVIGKGPMTDTALAIVDNVYLREL
jgi:hypothetical protein